jgi:hypothetical protein
MIVGVKSRVGPATAIPTRDAGLAWEARLLIVSSPRDAKLASSGAPLERPWTKIG